MKIGTISDLHIDRHTYINSEGYMQALVDCAIKRQLDLLIIAGDISNNYQMTCAFISQVKAQINIPVLFVPGNHDYWSDQLDHSSTDIVTSFRQQPECLMTQPYIINDNWEILGQRLGMIIAMHMNVFQKNSYKAASIMGRPGKTKSVLIGQWMIGNYQNSLLMNYERMLHK